MDVVLPVFKFNFHSSCSINSLEPKEIFSTVEVEPNGEYVEPPQAKMSYATMVFVRTAIGQSLTLMMIQHYD